MSYFIYKITNLTNNKIYIGKTSNLKHRWYIHCYTAINNKKKKYPIHHAIAKYGKENFIFEEIDSAQSNEEICIKEIQWIKYFKSQNYEMYNLTNGGEGISGWVHSKETKEKISKSSKGRLCGNKNPMYNKGHLIEGQNNPFYGKKHSSETISNMSNNRTGSKNAKSILTEQNVKDIKKNNLLSVKELSIKYNVKPITIYKILNGTNWGHIS